MIETVKELAEHMNFTFIRNDYHPLLVGNIKRNMMNPRDHYAVAIWKPENEI